MPCFVNGGVLPDNRRGVINDQLIALWDWYGTFAGMVDRDVYDPVAARFDLPQPDSLNFWDYIMGRADTTPRLALTIGLATGSTHDEQRVGNATVGGVILPPYKLLLGGEIGVIKGVWSGPLEPNDTVRHRDLVVADTEVCGRTPQTGCLFNVWEDPSERVNLAASQPHVFHRLLQFADEQERHVFSPQRPKITPPEYCEAVQAAGGWIVPYLDVPDL